jgi:hypothetical protein
MNFPQCELLSRPTHSKSNNAENNPVFEDPIPVCFFEEQSYKRVSLSSLSDQDNFNIPFVNSCATFFPDEGVKRVSNNSIEFSNDQHFDFFRIGCSNDEPSSFKFNMQLGRAPDKSVLALKDANSAIDNYEKGESVSYTANAPINTGSVSFTQAKRRRMRPPKKACGCKSSKCLRLHCLCFKQLGYCTLKCGCVGCLNVPVFEDSRSFVIEKTIEINKNAFKAKTMLQNEVGKTVINTYGCSCKSGCINKYCACSKMQTGCSPLCRCKSCENVKIEIGKEQVHRLYNGQRRKKLKIVINDNNHGSATDATSEMNMSYLEKCHKKGSDLMAHFGSGDNVCITIKNFKKVKPDCSVNPTSY